MTQCDSLELMWRYASLTQQSIKEGKPIMLFSVAEAPTAWEPLQTHMAGKNRAVLQVCRLSTSMQLLLFFWSLSFLFPVTLFMLTPHVHWWSFEPVEDYACTVNLARVI